MIRTVIFKLYKFDGHIYINMTKNELKRLIVECINEVRIEEGAITAQEMTDSVIGVIKSTIKKLNRQINSLNFKYINIGYEQIQFVADVINKEIDEKLFKTGKIPCVIEFVKIDRNKSSSMVTMGSYSHDTKKIKLNSESYLSIPRRDEDNNYKLRDMTNMNFGAIYDTIEHELIHQQQDERSRGKLKLYDKGYFYLLRKYDSDGDGFLNDDEKKKVTSKDMVIYKKLNSKEIVTKFKTILDKKSIIAPKMSDEEFMRLVKYYNRELELNTYAKDVVNRYVNSVFKDMKRSINWGNLENREYSSDEVKNFVLSPTLNFSGNKIFDVPNDSKGNTYKDYLKSRFKQKIIEYHNGYKYLTVENKKKWWRYVFQLLMNYKFDPIILKK